MSNKRAVSRTIVTPLARAVEQAKEYAKGLDMDLVIEESEYRSISIELTKLRSRN